MDFYKSMPEPNTKEWYEWMEELARREKEKRGATTENDAANDNNIFGDFKIFDKEDEDPNYAGDICRQEGNKFFQQKQYRKALASYSNGLKNNITDITLLSQLYNNRSAAHFYEKNYSNCYYDCLKSLEYCQNNIKVLVRICKALFIMRKYGKCIIYCKMLLELKKDDEIIKMMNESESFKAKRKVEKSSLILKRKHEFEKLQKIKEALKIRGVKLAGKNELNQIFGDFNDSKSTNNLLEQYELEYLKQYDSSIIKLNNVSVFLSDHNILHWPAIIAYPEFYQTDIIQSFPETHSFIDQLKPIIDDKLPWDINNQYSWTDIEIYFENKSSQTLVKIDTPKTLLEVTKDARFLVYGMTIFIIVLSKKSKFYLSFLNNYSIDLM